MVTASPPPQPPLQPPPPPPLSDLIDERWHDLMAIRRRLYFLHAFQDEMKRLVRRKRFRPRNDIVWRMALDHRDKCYIDLYSFTVEMRHWMPFLDRKGQVRQPDRRDMQRTDPGIFYYVREHYLSNLSGKHVPGPGDDRYEIEMDTASKERRFKRWFPSCQGDNPTATDLDHLCLTVQLRMCHLGEDRNQIRAHFFESKRRAKRIGQTTRMLDLTELDQLFQYCDDLLEDLSLLSGGPALGSGNMNLASCEHTARDLADQVLLGDVEDIRKFIKDGKRDAFYARMHEIHDNREGVDPPEFFNDAQWTIEYLSEAGLWENRAASPD
jgi:hypothetical protein